MSDTCMSDTCMSDTCMSDTRMYTNNEVFDAFSADTNYNLVQAKNNVQNNHIDSV
jgi:hypothetical protein